MLQRPLLFGVFLGYSQVFAAPAADYSECRKTTVAIVSVGSVPKKAERDY
jgi:hypothetical protein